MVQPFSKEVTKILVEALISDDYVTYRRFDDLVIKEAYLHNVALLIAAISGHTVGLNPKIAVLNQLRELRQKATISLVNKFRSRNISFLQFKGENYQWIFRDHNYRHVGDVDLLISEKQLQAALGCLQELGFNYVTKIPPECFKGELKVRNSIELINQNGVIVDLHTRLAEVFFPWSISYEHLSERHNSAPLETEIIISCLNAAKKGWQELSGLLDLFFLLKGENYNQKKLDTIIADLGVEKVVRTTNFLMWHYEFSSHRHFISRNVGDCSKKEESFLLQHACSASKDPNILLKSHLLALGTKDKVSYLYKRFTSVHGQDWENYRPIRNYPRLISVLKPAEKSTKLILRQVLPSKANY